MDENRVLHHDIKNISDKCMFFKYLLVFNQKYPKLEGLEKFIYGIYEGGEEIVLLR